MKKVFVVFTIVVYSPLLVFISCKKGSNCTDSDISSEGPLFTAVQSLISTRCSGSNCHMDGKSAGGFNFDKHCSIADYYNDIQSVCNSGRMPVSPQSRLTAAEKAVINDWVAAGHSLSN